MCDPPSKLAFHVGKETEQFASQETFRPVSPRALLLKQCPHPTDEGLMWLCYLLEG